MKDYIEVFDSLEQFESVINSRSLNHAFENAKQRSQTEGFESWYGTKTYEEANEMLKNGAPQLAQKITSANIECKKFSSNDTQYRATFRKNVSGSRAVVPAYLANVPNNMLRREQKTMPARIINVIVSASVGCGVKAESICAACAKIANVINSIELNNIRVNLYASSLHHIQKQNAALFINIKKDGAPLNKLRIAYPLMSPSFLRRHSFRWLETVPKKLDTNITRYYGKVMPINDIAAQTFKGKKIAVINLQTDIIQTNANENDIYNFIIKQVQ